MFMLVLSLHSTSHNDVFPVGHVGHKVLYPYLYFTGGSCYLRVTISLLTKWVRKGRCKP